ncbi:MAG TPA: SGNH/GDSL hydrolase family protein [Thermoanaerobaculia bacterium]|nr:SGNH/GDSL hydrolase family protein [Thermoanaerobaculia bacterium]
MTFISIYGDSLSLPRAGDAIPPEATYAELLRSRLGVRGIAATVLNRSRGGATIDELYRDYRNDLGYIGEAPGQVLIIQCGIVDCAPRPLSRRGRQVVGRLPAALRSPIVSFLHRKRAALLSRGVSFRYTQPSRFAAVLDGWLRHAAPRCSRILVINIAPTTAETEQHSPGLTASIETFNDLIAGAVRDVPNASVVDVHRILSSSAAELTRCINESDGHHITAAGHQLFAEAVETAIAAP